MARTVKKNVRFDSHHIRLRTGETEKKNGYEYRWTTPDGKRHSTFAPTLDKLREIEEDLAADKHDGIKTDVKGLTVNDCYELWKELKRGIKDSTYKNYIYMYEMFVKPTFGQKKVTKVLKSDVKRFYNTLADDKHLKVSTIDNIHNVLHQVFQVAVDDNYIRGNPTDRMLKELKVAHGHEIEKRKALSMAQQELFINYIRETEKYQHWYPVFYIMLNTGMRVGELTGLRWRDVDFENGMISVNHTLVYYNHQDELGTYYSINTPKTDAGKREIPIVEGVREAFEMERKYQEENGIVSKSRIDGYEDFIFVNRNGEVQHQGTLNKALKRIMRDCNDQVLLENDLESEPTLLPNFSCHVLRHTFATRICEAGVNLKVIQDKVLGRIANSAEGLILVFDLEEAIMFDALPEEYVDKRTGELKKRIKVYYPEKYEGRIGNYYHDYVATEQISMFENLNEYEDGQNGEAQTATPSATEEMASTQDSPYQRTAPMPGGALNE